jgi:type II secretory pathway pseudopilin PulG
MRNRATTRVCDPQSGYALLLVMFFVALLVLATLAAAPSVLTQVRREKEQQMIWRGRQYALGVQRYYAKLHRFPTSLEDLYKPKTGIRFMRQAYKDPTNRDDGTWRLIYVGPNGQLIGSLKMQQPGLNLNSAASQSGFSGGFGSQGQSSFGGISASGSQASGNGSMFAGSGTSAGSPPPAAATGAGQSTDASGTASAEQPPTYADTSNIIGGNIIGVGGKINQKSIIWYDKAKDYRHFEFIWDPSMDQLTGQRIGQIPPNPGINGTQPGNSTSNPPFSTGTNSNQNPTQNPNTPPMNPQPTPPEQ